MKIKKSVIFILSCTIATQALPAWQIKTAALQALQYKMSPTQALCISAGVAGLSYAAHRGINYLLFSRSKKMKIYIPWVRLYEDHTRIVEHFQNLALSKKHLPPPLNHVIASRNYFHAEKWIFKHEKWIDQYKKKLLDEKLEEYSNHAFTVGAASTAVPLSIILPIFEHVIVPWARQQSMGIKITVFFATGAIALTPPIASVLYFAVGINDPQMSQSSPIFILQCGLGAIAGEFVALSALALTEIFNLKLNRF